MARMRTALRDFRVQLGLVTALALVVRVWAVLAWSRFLNPEGDQEFYWTTSQHLAEGFGYVYRDSNTGELFQTAFHPPMHSILLAVPTFVLGDRMQGDAHVYHRLACAVIGAAAVFVVGVVAHKLAGKVAGIAAALLAAVYPNLWINDALMVSESTTALMMALVLLAAYEFSERPALRTAAVLGAITALATLARAEAQVLFVIMIPPLIWWAREREAPRWKLLGAAWLVGMAVLAPWIGRNMTTFENPVLISSGSGYVLEVASCDITYGLAPPTDIEGNVTNPDPTTFLGYWTLLCDPLVGDKPRPPGDETVIEKIKRDDAIEYISNHKSRLPVVVAARLGRMWDVWRPAQSVDFNVFFERRGHWPTLGGMAMYYPMLIASVGALVWMRRQRLTLVPFVSLAAMVSITAASSFGITRYRVGVDVALCILAGVAVGAVWRAWRSSSELPPDAAHADDPPGGGSSDQPADLVVAASVTDQ